MFTADTLAPYIADRRLRAVRHPDAPYTLYNYTPSVQYGRLWDDVTCACRGLILDDDGGIIARPLRKFFNIGEHEPHEIPAEPFEVFEKLDGSLAILYWIGDEPHMATRGSFTGPQAVWATEILHRDYRSTFAKLKRDRTYCFELIHPQNRIVVDYGTREDLVLLAVIDNATGGDLPLDDVGFPIVERHDGLRDIDAVLSTQRDNAEGFVIRFENGLRVKVKHDEYTRLHAILTNVSNRGIWEILSEGGDMGAVLDRVPDEFHEWVAGWQTRLKSEFFGIEFECLWDYESLALPRATRKESAEVILQRRYPAVLFAMLDGRPYDHIIWRMLRPETHEQPFAARADA